MAIGSRGGVEPRGARRESVACLAGGVLDPVAEVLMPALSVLEIVLVPGRNIPPQRPEAVPRRFLILPVSISSSPFPFSIVPSVSDRTQPLLQVRAPASRTVYGRVAQLPVDPALHDEVGLCLDLFPVNLVDAPRGLLATLREAAVSYNVAPGYIGRLETGEHIAARSHARRVRWSRCLGQVIEVDSWRGRPQPGVDAKPSRKVCFPRLRSRS